MTAKIKLNAASGGGSVSLQAPTSTTGNANIELKLPVADGSGFLKSDGSGNLSNSLTTSGTDNFTIADGNLVIGTSGHGIDFSATSDGSGTSNVSELLTDFETGTFSLGGPVIGGGSFTATVGRYTRIGNVCHVFVVADSFSTSGQNYDLQLSGLPFTSSSSNASHAVVSTNAPSFSSGIKANIPSSNTIMAIRSQWADDGIKSQVFNGYGIAFNATYIVG